ncbi:MAG: NAD(P)H-hydrate dehydratase [Deltaproteobacteria bacterium]|nr:NAD(P)H-hydrate dehydratase [Deltaproteobacteria bacterium]
MKLLTTAQVRALDRLAIKQWHIPSLTLMEHAGRGVAEAVGDGAAAPGPIAIVCGKGNNGGDGFVAARYLVGAGYRVECFCLAGEESLSPDAAANRRRAAALPIAWHDIASPAALRAVAGRLAQAAAVVDAVFGTGLTQPIAGHVQTIIEWINASGRPVVAVDIPSGIDGDTGRIMGAAVRAEVTATLGLPKIGLVVAPGYDYAGRLAVIDIGLPPAAVAAIDTPYAFTGVEDVAGVPPPRTASHHKGAAGHCLVIAGALGTIGAGYLASRACLRAGCGLVTYALPRGAYAKFDPAAAEVMMAPLPDDGAGILRAAAWEEVRRLWEGKAAVVLGPGLGQAPETAAIVARILCECPLPIVLDADGLNAIAGNVDLLHERPVDNSTQKSPTLLTQKSPTLLTPHPGEMGRLTGTESAAVQADRLGTACRFARAHGVVCVLKGHRTITALPDGRAFINSTGNPGMATAGMGDVLAGVLAGLIAQGVEPAQAAVAGVYFHGRAGDLAAARTGHAGLIASDVIECLPKALDKADTSTGQQ